VTRPVIERYQRFVHLYRKRNGLPLSASTQCGRLGPVKMFFKWLSRHSFILYTRES
jgi:integrase/recombinase XerD